MHTSTTFQTLKFYWQQNLQHKGLFALTNTIWITGMLLQKLILPLIVATAFSQIIENQNAGTLEWKLFVDDVVLFIITALAAQALIDGGLIFLSRIESASLPQLNLRVFNKLMSQSMHFHNNNFGGALVNQASRFVNGYVAVTDTFVINISQLAVFVLFSSIVLFFYSPLIATTIFVWAILFLMINITLTRRRIPYSRARAKADSAVTGYFADSVANIATIKTFSAEAEESKKFHVLAKDRAHKGYVYWIRSIKNDAIFGLLMVLLQLLVLVVSIYALRSGSITVGTLILAQVYITQIIAYLWGLSNITKNLEQNLSDAAEMTEILLQDNEVNDAPHAKKLRVKHGAIAFRDVMFTHIENNDALFEHLSFSAAVGEKIGLVGPSGGGKTTITKLLLRFMDIQAGEITIDGQNIADVTQRSLRDAIAYVPQEPLLFHRSLAENIAYGRPSATQEEIEAAARKAHAHSFIRELPNGYKTMVGERGVKLSGGQRQRIAIARAILKNAPILVLDEATSALDSESELLIQDALRKLMEDRTTVVIAHRLSTIQNMDRIIVLSNGQIIEQGAHHQLVKSKGTYAKLWNHQSGGFLED